MGRWRWLVGYWPQHALSASIKIWVLSVLSQYYVRYIQWHERGPLNIIFPEEILLVWVLVIPSCICLFPCYKATVSLSQLVGRKLLWTRRILAIAGGTATTVSFRAGHGANGPVHCLSESGVRRAQFQRQSAHDPEVVNGWSQLWADHCRFRAGCCSPCGHCWCGHCAGVSASEGKNCPSLTSHCRSIRQLSPSNHRKLAIITTIIFLFTSSCFFSLPLLWHQLHHHLSFP